MSSKNILDFPEDNSPDSDWYVLVAKEDGCYVKVKLSNLPGGVTPSSTTSTTTTTAASTTTSTTSSTSSTTSTTTTSAPTTTSTTTTAAPALVDVNFTTKTSNVVNVSGVWDAGLTTDYSEYGITSVKIPAGQEGWVQWEFAADGNTAGYFGFKTTPGAPVIPNLMYQELIASTLWPLTSLSNPVTNNGVPSFQTFSSGAAIGNFGRIRRQVGGTITLELSTDGGGIGGTWNVVYTFAATSVADLYVACNFANDGVSIKKLYYPKVFNAS